MKSDTLISGTELECSCGEFLEHVEMVGDLPTGTPREYYECPGCGEQWDMDLEPIDLNAVELI